MWLFLAEELPPDQIIQENPECCQKEPQHRKFRADLPENVARHIAVIPHIPVQIQVYYLPSGAANTQRLRT